MAFERIAVIGAGAWGCALANVITRAGRVVTLAARTPEGAAELARQRVSPRLPGIALDPRIEVATGPDLAARHHDAILLAVPAQSLRAAALVLGPSIARGTPVISCAKGIERGTRKFMTDVIAECLPLARPAVLSGPSFAADVARGLPTAVTLAFENSALENSALEDALDDGGDAAKLAAALGSASFRPYHTTDIRGVEIGGAAKNVLAIAAGIVTGRGLGASAAAALTTRGFAELFRFGKAFGARPETLTGLSGLGDLVLTCSSPQSRNFALGVELGKGAPIGATPIGATQSEPKLAEGAATAPVLVEMAQSKGVEMPIAEAVAAILAGRASIAEAIENLLTRPFRAEG
ncbi:MAG TPA: NAD(P)H-dependent glycerol-3-phosphate dehydrogenase [Xanthobacteraceae bacterium]|jgi:glycerol-3-phosphate dehydrogenase (NAD(P)+)|nr:NAD(P)H-dependent glycerol-3-phosphate dehydrogenase [Xanthobacteraceae bacterium]